MNFIKKVADKNIDDSVHLQFQKFSRGEFKNRAGIKAKKTKDKYVISTTGEFSNELVRIVAEKLGDKKTLVKGIIVSTNDLTGKLDFKDKKQFQGVKKYEIEKEMSGKEIISLLNNFPKAFFALSFNAEDTNLKIKPKMPKSGKPSSKGDEAPVPDFCKIETTDKKLAESFVFEKPDFKTAEINHEFIIQEIVIPSELKNEKDFAKVREMSRRKGKIIRKANIDDVKSVKEIMFEA